MTVTTDKPTYMQHMPHFVSPLAPFTAESAKGSWVTDTDGNKWLDMLGWTVALLTLIGVLVHGAIRIYTARKEG